ncbi:MAG: hypothetical protein JWN64_664 [Parcubacteria group bacterium]|nr:hypothetical protein [Parcubacteria group bacterium]
MTWLTDFFKIAFFWVIKNPILIVLVIIIAIFNQFFADVGLDTKGIQPLHPDTIWAFTLTVLHFILSPTGFGIITLTLFAAAAITMFNTATTFAVMAGEKQSWKLGMKALFSDRTLILFFLSGLTQLTFGILFLLGMWLTVPVGGQHDILGSVIIVLCTAVAYPIFYMLTSVLALIVAAPVSFRERLEITRVLFFTPKNLRRISTFYIIRIGAEAIAVGAVLLLINLVELPPVISSLLLILAVSIPFALVRTTGLVIKLDMLRNNLWFSHYFRTYYAGTSHATVATS